MATLNPDQVLNTDQKQKTKTNINKGTSSVGSVFGRKSLTKTTEN